MEWYKLNNLFTPALSKRIFVTMHTNLEPITLHIDRDFDEEMTEYSILFGISDTAKLNKNYTELIIELSISKISNNKAIEKIVDIWSDNGKWDNDCLIPKLLEDNVDICIEENQVNCQNIENEIIYIWRTTKLPLPSIAFKLDIFPIIVYNTISNYKSLVRKNIQDNITKRNKQNVVICAEKLNILNEYWWSNSNEIIHIKDIKKNVWTNDDNNEIPWDSTITTALKRKLGMTYKWLKSRHPKSQSSENKRLYIEASLVQCILSSTEYEIIFINEFQINNRK